MPNILQRLIVTSLIVVTIIGTLSCGGSKSRTVAPTPIPLQVSTWQNVTLYSVNLVVNELGDFQESKFITKTTQNLFAGMGIKVVQSPPYDATVTITETGNFFEVPYEEVETGLPASFRGASTIIAVTLNSPQRETIKVEDSAQQFPPSRPTSKTPQIEAKEVIIPALIGSLTYLWNDYLPITALEDPDTEVRYHAAIKLSLLYSDNKTMGIAQGAALKLAKAWLRDPSIWSEGSAIDSYSYKALLALGDRAYELIPTCVELIIRDDKPNIIGFNERQTQAGKLLINIGPAAVPTLIQLLEHQSNNIRSYAASALGDGELAPSVISALIKALRDNHSFTVEKAAESLLKNKPEIVLPTLIEILRDKKESTQVRGNAANAMSYLWRDKPDKVLPILLEVLNDDKEEVMVRKSVEWPLVQLGTSSYDVVLPALINILDTESEDFGYSVAGTLKIVGPPAIQAVPSLVNALKKERFDVGKTIYTSALKAITGQDFGNNTDRWQKWWEQQH